MRRPLIPKDGRLDRIGGRLLYRAFGLAFACIALGMAVTALVALANGHLVAAAMFGLPAIALAVLVRWCFSKNRRLHEGDWC